MIEQTQLRSLPLQLPLPRGVLSTSPCLTCRLSALSCWISSILFLFRFPNFVRNSDAIVVSSAWTKNLLRRNTWFVTLELSIENVHQLKAETARSVSIYSLIDSPKQLHVLWQVKNKNWCRLIKRTQGHAEATSRSE